ncbi:MAG: DNA polymerase III subunit epsilon [Pelagibacterales bacterium]|nr:DNA polymerase III subunit epsilon [Pelagibacterales bacterium]
MYSIVDLEATGGKFNEESIIEIAIYKYDGNKVVVDQFISLINPDKEISPYVEKLTGINAKMVKTAPLFNEVAKRILEITDDSILVAHNAQFDYRLLQIEFDRLGYEYIKESICTVILSQKLLPNRESYKLGKLVKSLGIPLTQRHRASGDARATVDLFKLLIEKDIKKQIISKNIVTYLGQNVRSVFNKIIEDIKNETGVFYIYNHNNEIIYIEASKTIKNRINRLFTSNKFIPKSIQNNIKNVKVEPTGSFYLALIKKFSEIDHIKPAFNKIDYVDYDKSVKEFNAPSNEFLIIDKGRGTEEKSFLLVSSKKIIGYGFFELNNQINTKEKLYSRLIKINQNQNIENILNYIISKQKFKKLIPLNKIYKKLNIE